jgi:hypothetical protein
LQLQRVQDQPPAQPPPLRDEPDLSCFHVDIGLETDDNHYIARPYTPLSTEEEYHKGTMSLVVKTYTQGKFTPLLAAKGVGTINSDLRYMAFLFVISGNRQHHLLFACRTHPGPAVNLPLVGRHIRRHW